MALEVETGTGSASAESYASVTQADTRLAALGMTNWAGLEVAKKEQALRRATVFIEQRYRDKWKGTRLYRAQALSWPRYGACVDGYDILSTEVPTELANATIDLALKAAAGDLNADLTRAIVREKVGPLETEYAEHSPQSVRYVSIEQTLSPFLRGGGAVRLIRA